jgi:hypothetical protein
MRKIASAVLIILGVAFVLGIIYLGYSSQIHPASTPIRLYNYTIYSDTGVATSTLNASQGLTQQLNLTLTAMTFSPSIAVPIDSIKLTSYNSTINYGNNWDTRNWNKPLVQSSVFNYSFSLNTLTLQPNTSNSTIISINWADNAPTGRYTAEINLGNFKFLSTQGKYDQSYGSSIWLRIVVTPKVTQP